MTFESYSRPSGVLHNKLDTDDEQFLQKQETALSRRRISDIENGLGPKGNFDTEHLKAIHKHIFQDVYPWAGHTRSESFSADGNDYDRIQGMQKNGSRFLPASRLDFGLNYAVEPLKNLEVLKTGTTAEFAEKAGESLGRLNYAHPFREGNGRTQRAFISMLGQETGHEVDFSVISEGRNLEASISVFNNPERADLKDMVHDATDPSRRHALGEANKVLRKHGMDPDDHVVRTAKVGETLEGGILSLDKQVSAIVMGSQLIVLDNADLHGLSSSDRRETVKVEVKSDLSDSYDKNGRPARKTKQARDDDYGR